MGHNDGQQRVQYDEWQVAAVLDELARKLPLKYRDVLVCSMNEEKEHGLKIRTSGNDVLIKTCQCVRAGEQIATVVVGYAVARMLDQHMDIKLCLPLRSYDVQRSFKLVCEVLRGINHELVDFVEHVFTGVVRMTLEIPMVDALVTPAPIQDHDERAESVRSAIQAGQVLVSRTFGDDELDRLLNMQVVGSKPRAIKPYSGEELQQHNLLRAALGYQLGKGHGTAPKGSN